MKFGKEKMTAGAPAKMKPTVTGEQTKPAAPLYEYITAKSWAESVFARMGKGRQNAVYVNGRDAYDLDVRAFKKMIADARKNGVPIVSGRDGTYWIADMDDPEDREAVEHQIRSLLSRAREIEAAAYAMADANLPGMRP